MKTNLIYRIANEILGTLLWRVAAIILIVLFTIWLYVILGIEFFKYEMKPTNNSALLAFQYVLVWFWGTLIATSPAGVYCVAFLSIRRFLNTSKIVAEIFFNVSKNERDL